MKRYRFVSLLLPILLWDLSAAGVNRFVDSQNPNAAAPYSSWATAAVTIQDAIDVATDGDLILVTNGIYSSGGRVVHGGLLSRVAVDKAVTVESVNGPEVTFIEGNPLLGENAVRCAYLTNGALLSGFTLTNGATRATGTGAVSNDLSGGGVWCVSTNALVSNCVIVSNSCAWWGAGAFSGTLRNCQIVSNFNANFSPYGGGGAALSAIYDSSIIGNRCGPGNAGAAKNSFLSNCIVQANSDGIFDSTAYNCSIVGNGGPGVSGGTVFYSLIASNVGLSGGGAFRAILNNCSIIGNRAQVGGGANNCVLNFCTVSNNYATNMGGGVFFDGFAPGANPGQATTVVGNVSGGDAGGLSIRGQPLTNWVFLDNIASGNGGGCSSSSGAVLYNATFSGNSAANGGGLFVGPFSGVCINSTFTNNFATGDGGGACNVMLGNCVLIGNQAANGAGAVGGATNCVFEKNNATLSGGGLYTFSGFIKDCFFRSNSAANGGALSFPSGLVTNCVMIGNSARTNGGGVFSSSPHTVRNSLLSSNCAAFGGASYNGIYIDSTLIGNHATNSGGAVYQPVSVQASSNNIVTGNWAGTNGGGVYGGTWANSRFTHNSAGQNGGGGYNCTIQNSILSDNSALLGGGVYFGNLKQCLLTGNRAQTGGAAHNSNNYPINNCTIAGNFATNNAGGVFATSGMALVNSIVYFNTATTSNNYSGTANSFCCLTPFSAGTSNIVDDPALIDFAGGNFRLQANSPCINTGGGTSEPPESRDLDGRPRIVGGRPDMGAYEFQASGIGEFSHWLAGYGLPTNGSADTTDSDKDGHVNFEEWSAGTIPTNSLSVLRMLEPVLTPDGWILSWESVSGKTYLLERASSLAPTSTFSVVQSNIVGQAGISTWSDPTATTEDTLFYRVKVQ